MEKIVSLQLEQVTQRLLERHISLQASPKAIKYLAEEGYDPVFGARPLKRLIQNEVVNPIANKLLEGKIPNHCSLLINTHKKGEGHAIDFEVKAVD
jgi:ATP-dependent Clp protease ATP-binding subunit ClpB